MAKSSKKTSPAYVLAADVGGTNARFALYANGKRARLDVYASEAYDSLEAPLEDFLGSTRVTAAVVAVAGPVVSGEAKLTNLKWTVREKKLAKLLGGAPVRIINDLVAVGHGCLAATGSQKELVKKGTPVASGNVAIIAPGTGLGEAMFVNHEGALIPTATEGSHVDFAAQNDTEWALFDWLGDRYGHVSYERIVSGRGLADVYDFLVTEHGRHETAANRKFIEAAEEKPAAVSELARKKKSQAALEAVDIFLAVYGAEAGNLALKALATGGVYLSGNITRALAWRFAKSDFEDRFLSKGRMRALTEKIPIYAVTDSHAGLDGSAYYAASLRN